MTSGARPAVRPALLASTARTAACAIFAVRDSAASRESSAAVVMEPAFAQLLPEVRSGETASVCRARRASIGPKSRGGGGETVVELGPLHARGVRSGSRLSCCGPAACRGYVRRFAR